MTMDPDPHLSWGRWERYLPVLLGGAIGVFGGLFIRYGIIGEYYADEPPERDEKEVERLLTGKKSGKTRKSKPKRYRMREDE